MASLKLTTNAGAPFARRHRRCKRCPEINHKTHFIKPIRIERLVDFVILLLFQHSKSKYVSAIDGATVHQVALLYFSIEGSTLALGVVHVAPPIKLP